MKKITAIILSAILFAMLPIASYASISDCDIETVIKGIIDYKIQSSNDDSLEDWINGSLSDGVGESSEWYSIALHAYGVGDLTKYADALEKYISENEIFDKVVAQKYALILMMCGRADNPFVQNTVEKTIGGQGVMSLIFGLHLIANGVTSSKYDVDSLISELSAFQLDDGGFSLDGKSSMIDTTAMVLQALSVYKDRADVTGYIEKSLQYLSENRQESGGFVAYGAENCESACQVLIALSSLGIDCQTDERFIKDGKTLFDIIAEYRLEDGSFKHVADGKSNSMATVQSLLAYISYYRYLNGLPNIYNVNSVEIATTEPTEESESEMTEEPIETVEENENTEISEKEEENSSIDEEPQIVKYDYKIIVVSIASAVALLAVLLIFILKKNRKNILFVVILLGAVCAFVFLTDFQSTTDYYGDAVKESETVGTVTVSIDCSLISDEKNDYIPKNGEILEKKQFDISENDTVFDVLVKAARTNNIALDHKGTVSGSSELAYIRGINYIYEFDYGALSGWVYFVNGVRPSVGCGEYALHDGDEIEWKYTLSLGDDLGGDSIN